MRFIFHTLSKPRHHHHHLSRRGFVDIGAITWVRDRGLDHAVEKENHLKPLLNLKNLLKSEPSHSLPLSLIAQNRETLEIPLRPIDFVRKFPSVFEEFLPGGIGIHPHIKLTPQVLDLDAEEQLIYHSDSYKQQVADRLLKVLMLTQIRKIPLHVIDRLKWDLGLPQDFTETIVPEFPDYFQLTGEKNSILELVCWCNELAVSVIEKKAMNGKMGYEKGMPIAFDLQYSRGFEMDKKFKNWVDDWQKLPYISPYENASHFQSKSDESDKWVVAVLHELLHLLIPKKTDRENVLCLGEYLGLRGRFKMALLHHPGIFYLSSKNGTRTVVLKEAYKRDLLFEKHPLMMMRYKYIHLMNMGKEDQKPKTVQGGGSRQQKASNESKEAEEVEDNEQGEEQEKSSNGLSDSEFVDESDDDCSDYDDEEDEDESEILAHKNMATKKGRTTRKTDFGERGRMRTMPNRSFEGNPGKNHDRKASNFSRRTERSGGHDVGGNSQERSDAWRTRGRSKYDNRNDDDEKDGADSEALAHKSMETNKGRINGKTDFEERGPMRTMPNRSFEGNPGKSHDRKASKFSRTETRGGHRFGGNSRERSDAQRTRGRSKYDNRNNFDDKRDGADSEALAHKSTETNKGRITRKRDFEEKGPMRTMPKRSFEGKPRKSRDTNPSKFSRRTEMRGGHDTGGNSLEHSDARRTKGRSKYADRRTFTQ